MIDLDRITFADEEHRKLFVKICGKFKQIDPYHLAVAYLLSVDRVIRPHINKVFDFDEDVIKPESLRESWQTSTSLKTSRLLFNLWNGYDSEGEPISEEKTSPYYTPEHIFSCSYAPYYWQAIKLRYPEYIED